MTFHDLYELEAVVDAGVGGDGGAGDQGSGGDAAGAGDGGQGGAGADAGAAVASTSGAGDGTPAPVAFDFNEWAQTDEGRQQLGSTFTSWAEQQQAQAREAEAAAARAQENPFSDVEEGLGLLGIDAARFKEYLGVQNAPLMSVAEKVQNQEAVQWVDGQLTSLGQTHPDLLGEGVDKLSELVDDEGAPLFAPDEVRGMNRNAVLYAASALQNASVDATGNPTLGHDVALAEGAKQTAARDQLVAKIAVERFKAELQNSGNAPRDLGGGGGGAERITGLEGGDELTVARRINAERTN